MRNMHGVLIEPKAQQLVELDERIRENGRDLSRLTRAKAPADQLRAVADFLQILFDRRETILREMAKLGLSEGDVYRELRVEAEKKEAAARCTG